MTTPAHYPHAYAYLSDHMARISRAFVVLGLAGITALVVVLAIIGGLQVLA